jgi:hypothetical protein
MDAVAMVTRVPSMALQGPSLRKRVLDTIAARGPLSAADVQAIESMHSNTVRIILARLVCERALVKVPVLPRTRIDPYFRYALAGDKSNGESHSVHD